MKPFFLLLWTALLLTLGTATLGCEYVTYDEEMKLETDAGSPPDADMTDAGAPLGDAELGDGDVWKDRGASGSKQLTRGSRQQTTILNEAFLDDSGVQVASVYTLQFAIQATPAPPGSPLEPPTLTYAIITWSIGGNQITRKISVSNGASITGVGAGCSVAVFDATGMAPAPVPPLTPDDPVPNYNVLVTLTPGSRGESALPPVFYPIPSAGVLGPNVGPRPTSVLIAIPPNSGATSVQVTAVNGSDVTTNALVSQVGTNNVVQKQYKPDIQTGFVALDPSSTSILIENFDATHELAWSIVFGIDG